MEEKYIVRIMEFETDRLVESFSPKSLRQCERLINAIEINLNDEEFYVDYIPEQFNKSVAYL